MELHSAALALAQADSRSFFERLAISATSGLQLAETGACQKSMMLCLWFCNSQNNFCQMKTFGPTIWFCKLSHCFLFWTEKKPNACKKHALLRNGTCQATCHVNNLPMGTSISHMGQNCATFPRNKRIKCVLLISKGKLRPPAVEDVKDNGLNFESDKHNNCIWGWSTESSAQSAMKINQTATKINQTHCISVELQPNKLVEQCICFISRFVVCQFDMHCNCLLWKWQNHFWTSLTSSCICMIASDKRAWTDKNRCAVPILDGVVFQMPWQDHAKLFDCKI